jgi:outer membrane protein assembly factor BamE
MLESTLLRLTLLPLALLLGSLAACSSAPASKNWLDTVSPYRFDRVQGNVVTREQVAALKPGMQRNLVKDILGTPLLTSVFHADRWDYVFTLTRQGSKPQLRHVAVFFKGDLMDRFEADELPSEAEFVATLKSMPSIEKLPPMEATAEKLQQFPPAAKPAPLLALPAAKAPSDYPPLEPVAK